MLEIHVQSYASVIPELQRLQTANPELWKELTDFGNATLGDGLPFVQLSYDELEGAEMDRLLGYAGIPQSNRPIGLIGDFNPTVIEPSGNERLLFPVQGLAQHFRSVAPDVFDAFNAAGSMDAFADQRGDQMSATEYLVGGTLECIRACERMHLALCFRW